MRFRLAFLFFCFVMVLGSPLFSEESPSSPSSFPVSTIQTPHPSVRVAVALDQPAIAIETKDAYEIRNGENALLIAEGNEPLQATVQSTENGIRVNDAVYEANAILIDGIENPVKVGKRTYHDQIRILKGSDNKLTAVNHLDIDDYIKGVLPLEVSAKWPLEALKAHAVISRTFALFQRIERREKEFELYDSVKSQVYGGALFHKERSDKAVDETSGEILTFNADIFPTFFHANCGGHTAKVDRVWRFKPHPALSGVPCPYCADTKHFRWKLSLTLGEMEKVMQSKGYPAKNLKNIEFVDTDGTRRIQKVKLTYERSELALKANDFRAFFGYDKFRSLNASVQVNGDKVHFGGFGWGHGVGFCQWGSKIQAHSGKNYKQILEFYYPGSEITNLNDQPALTSEQPQQNFVICDVEQ